MGEELRELVVRSIRGNVDLLRRATELGRGVAGELRAAPPAPQDLLDRLTRLNLQSLTLLTDYGQALAGELLGHAEKAFSPSGRVPATDAGATDEAAAPLHEMRVEVVEGGTGRTGFVIENRFSQAVSVSMSVTPFRSAQGDTAPAACVEIDPPSAVVPPNGSQLVIVEVETEGWFRPGVDYRATIHVQGNPSREVPLVVHALPADGQPEGGKEPAGQEKPAAAAETPPAPIAAPAPRPKRGSPAGEGAGQTAAPGPRRRPSGG
jgi:hypothetical protein